jgi:hypothetical protein
MVTVTIRIEATSSDPYARYQGLAVDSTLNEDFWVSQPEKIIGTSYPPFTWEGTVDLSVGSHRCEYGNSGYAKEPSVPYPWHTKIFVSGSKVAEGDVGRDQHLIANFNVAAPTKGVLEVHASSDSTEVKAEVEVVGIGTYYTPFSIELNPGTYMLNAKYDMNKQSKSASITAGQTTRVDFLFATTVPTVFAPIQIIAPMAFGIAMIILSR